MMTHNSLSCCLRTNVLRNWKKKHSAWKPVFGSRINGCLVLASPNLPTAPFKAMIRSTSCVCVWGFQWLHLYRMCQLIPICLSCWKVSVIADIDIQLKCARPSASLSDGVRNLIKEVSHTAMRRAPSPRRWERVSEREQEKQKSSGPFALFCFCCLSPRYSAGN